jgi:hypothetical protein
VFAVKGLAVINLEQHELQEICSALRVFKIQLQNMYANPLTVFNEIETIYKASAVPCIITRYTARVPINIEVKNIVYSHIRRMPKFKRLKLPESSWYEFVANFSKVEK